MTVHIGSVKMKDIYSSELKVVCGSCHKQIVFRAMGIWFGKVKRIDYCPECGEYFDERTKVFPYGVIPNREEIAKMRRGGRFA